MPRSQIVVFELNNYDIGLEKQMMYSLLYGKKKLAAYLCHCNDEGDRITAYAVSLANKIDEDSTKRHFKQRHENYEQYMKVTFFEGYDTFAADYPHRTQMLLKEVNTQCNEAYKNLKLTKV